MLFDGNEYKLFTFFTPHIETTQQANASQGKTLILSSLEMFWLQECAILLCIIKI